MRRKPNTVGGGSKTNLNGLRFEGRTDLLESLSLDTSFKLEDEDIKGSSKSCKIFKDNKYVGHYYEKHSFYNQYLELNDVDWKKLISKKYLPDSVFVNKNKYRRHRPGQPVASHRRKKKSSFSIICDFEFVTKV